MQIGKSPSLQLNKLDLQRKTHFSHTTTKESLSNHLNTKPNYQFYAQANDVYAQANDVYAQAYADYARAYADNKQKSNP